MKSCTFTGHRPDKFFFRYNENHPLCKNIKETLLEQAKEQYDRGVRRFYVGGAQGVDMWAGEVIIALKKLPAYSNIELICAVPFKGHDIDWDDAIHNRLEQLFSACDDIKVISSSDDPHAIRKRNYYLVENSQILIAVYDDSRRLRSGTSQTINYAKKLDGEIIFIHPETAAISYFSRK